MRLFIVNYVDSDGTVGLAGVTDEKGDVPDIIAGCQISDLEDDGGDDYDEADVRNSAQQWWRRQDLEAGGVPAEYEDEYAPETSMFYVFLVNFRK